MSKENMHVTHTKYHENNIHKIFGYKNTGANASTQECKIEEVRKYSSDCNMMKNVVKMTIR